MRYFPDVWKKAFPSSSSHYSSIYTTSDFDQILTIRFKSKSLITVVLYTVLDGLQLKTTFRNIDPDKREKVYIQLRVREGDTGKFSLPFFTGNGHQYSLSYGIVSRRGEKRTLVVVCGLKRISFSMCISTYICYVVMHSGLF